MINKLLIILLFFVILPLKGTSQTSEEVDFTIAIYKGQIRVVESTLKVNPKLANLHYSCPGTATWEASYPLHCAAYYDHLEIAAILIKYRARVNQRGDDVYNNGEWGPTGWTPLHVAVVKRNLLIANLLIRNKADVNARFFEPAPYLGGTLLHRAVYMGDIYLAEYLLKKGAKVNALDYSGSSPMCYNQFKNYKEMKLLLEEHKGKMICPEKE